MLNRCLPPGGEYVFAPVLMKTKEVHLNFYLALNRILVSVSVKGVIIGSQL